MSRLEGDRLKLHGRWFGEVKNKKKQKHLYWVLCNRQWPSLKGGGGASKEIFMTVVMVQTGGVTWVAMLWHLFMKWAVKVDLEDVSRKEDGCQIQKRMRRLYVCRSVDERRLLFMGLDEWLVLLGERKQVREETREPPRDPGGTKGSGALATSGFFFYEPSSLESVLNCALLCGNTMMQS